MLNQLIHISFSVRSYANAIIANLNGGSSSGRNSIRPQLLPLLKNSLPEAPDESNPPSPDTPPSECSFPSPSSVTVCPIQLPSGQTHFRLKVILDTDDVDVSDPNGGDKSPMTSAATMVLPLPNSDDQWCLINVAGVPRGGLQIPGLPISIQLATMENVCRTATTFKQRIMCPLQLVGEQSVY